MIFEKHLKLLRKFCGNIMRPRFGWGKKVTKFAKFFYLLIEWPFEVIGDVLFFWKRMGKHGIKDPHRILIIKIDQFGDVLFSTFLLPLIKKKYPDAEIDYLINPKTKPLLEKNPHIANVYFWEDIFLLSLLGREKSRSGSFGDIRKKNNVTMEALRARHYDAVINTRAYPPSSNIPWRRIGGALIAFDLSEQSFLADYWAEYDLDAEEWKNYLNLLTPLGIDTASAEFHEEFYNNDAVNPMSESIGAGGNAGEGDGRYAVLSPVSFDLEREWGKDKWKELVAHITSRGMRVALTGMPSQENYLNELAGVREEKANANVKSKVKVLTKMSLAELGALMKGSAFFVGIDSFPAHLALASGKPAVALINPGPYYLKGFSKKKFAMDARNMLPVIPQIAFFDVRSASVADLEAAVDKLMVQN
jgi:heptosyltransferase-1